MRELKDSLSERFASGVGRSGGYAEAGRQDLRPMQPGTEGRLATYCFKGTKAKWSSDGSRSPMAILSDLESTGQGIALWEEFTAAVTGDACS